MLWEALHWVRKTEFLDFWGVISTPTSPTHSQDNPPVVWSVRERPGGTGGSGGPVSASHPAQAGHSHLWRVSLRLGVSAWWLASVVG